MENKAYTFDDILILPQYSDIEREDVDIRSYFHWYCLGVPVMSSPMDTITETLMMQAIYEAGGLGFHHRYCDQDAVKNIEKLRNIGNIPGGIAVSPSMGIDDVLSLKKDGEYPLFILDVAHGYSKKNMDFCAELIKNECVVVSGNITSPQAVNDYLLIGVKDFRVGIGSGSVCTTRTVAGVGIPQAAAIREIYKYFKDAINDGLINIISDGGHKTTGDIVKALALGANFVMLGGMLAGCDEVPEWTKLPETNNVAYRGMASRDARNGIGKLDCIPEGITKEVRPKGPVANVLKEIEQAIKLACYYVGAKNLQELREKSEIIFVTENGYKEGLTR